MNGYLLAIFAVVFNVIANLALSSVLRSTELKVSFDSLLSLIAKLISTPVAWLAVVAAILSMATWAMTLSWLPLNKAIPVLSLIYILIPVLSHFLLGEQLSFRILLSAILIAVGVSLSASS